MRFGRRLIAGALACTTVVAIAPPAGAASRTYADEAGGVVDASGATVVDPRADILGVTVDNSPDEVSFVVEVDTAVPASDPGWTGDLAITAALSSPSGGGEFLFVTSTPDGPLGLVNSVCEVGFDIDTENDRYTLTVGQPCVRAFPRTGTPVVHMFNGDDQDVAPGDFDAEPELEPVSTGSPTAVRRLAGTDRILTANALSGDRFGAGGAASVVLASASSFPDALAGGPFATMAGAPLLLTAPSGLDARTGAEIDRVLMEDGVVFVLGGTAAVSDRVVADLQAAGHAVVRVAGTNRFETAVEIARRTDALLELLNGIPSGSAPTFLADGRSFQDALIAGAAAARTGGVLVLTEGSAMPAATASYLDGRSADELAIGSPATTARPSAGEKITGASPAQLSRRVLEQLGLAAGTVAVASEDVFADALAGGAHVGGLGPLLLTDGHTASDDLRAALEGQDGLRDVVLYGGTAAISSGVEQAIRTAVGA